MQKSIWNVTNEVLKYNAARPEHPVEIVGNAIKFLNKKYKGELNLAVDVGCGSGMSTVNLFGKFDKILGVDLSEAMIQEASNSFKQHEANVSFKVSPAECIPVENQSAQLVLVGRALHYFDQKTFFTEVDRMLVENGVVAYYSVHFPTVITADDSKAISPVNEIFWDYLDNKLYWPKNNFDGTVIGSRNRRDYYVSMPSPFSETEVDETISYDREMTLSQLAKELDTYGGAVRYRQIEGDKAGDDLIAEFIRRSMNSLNLDEETSPDNVKLSTRNSFFLVMKRKT